MSGCGCQGRANRLAAMLRGLGLRGLAAGFEQNHTQTLMKVTAVLGGLAVFGVVLTMKAGA
jgi:hypothetical protein